MKLFKDSNINFNDLGLDTDKFLYVYRDIQNRHGHSNVKPSYWALGYSTIKQMKESVTEEEYNNYVTLHNNCCGFKKI